MGRSLERDHQPVAVAERRLSQVQFQALDEIPHFLGWLADLTNPDTRRPAVTREAIGDGHSFGRPTFKTDAFAPPVPSLDLLSLEACQP